MTPTYVLAEEHDDATLSDGSLAQRAREMLLTMEGHALAYGFTRVSKPRVAIMSATCSRGPHLHVGFAAVPVDLETP